MQTRLIFAMPDGSVEVTEPGPARGGEPEPVWLDRVSRKCCPKGGKLVAVMNTADLPDRPRRDAWVWDGQRIVVDESRIKPPAPEITPAGAVVARDPRVDALGPQLSEQIAGAFQAMQAELDRKIAVEHRRAIEALTVASALKDGRQIEPGNFPALERALRDEGREVTSDEIVAAADEQARRSIELAGGL